MGAAGHGRRSEFALWAACNLGTANLLVTLSTNESHSQREQKLAPARNRYRRGQLSGVSGATGRRGHFFIFSLSRSLAPLNGAPGAQHCFGVEKGKSCQERETRPPLTSVEAADAQVECVRAKLAAAGPKLNWSNCCTQLRAIIEPLRSAASGAKSSWAQIPRLGAPIELRSALGGRGNERLACVRPSNKWPPSERVHCASGPAGGRATWRRARAAEIGSKMGKKCEIND